VLEMAKASGTRLLTLLLQVYINTSLRTKAHAHQAVPTITCTSSNVVQTVLQAFAQVRCALLSHIQVTTSVVCCAVSSRVASSNEGGGVSTVVREQLVSVTSYSRQLTD